MEAAPYRCYNTARQRTRRSELHNELASAARAEVPFAADHKIPEEKKFLPRIARMTRMGWKRGEGRWKMGDGRWETGDGRGKKKTATRRCESRSPVVP